MSVSFDAIIRNAGEIRSDGGSAITFISPGGGGMVHNTGTISGDSAGIRFVGWSDLGAIAHLVNGGEITASRGPAIYSDATHTQIENTGLISARGDDASGIVVSRAAAAYPYGTANILNSGTVEAAGPWGIDLGTLGGTAIVTNTGTISGGGGGILTSDQSDRVVNSGTISGDVDLGAGDDVFLGDTGRLAGVLGGGDGNDLLLSGKGRDTIFGGAGDDTIKGGGSQDVIDGGAGRDRILYDTNMTSVHVDLTAGRVTFPSDPAWGAETITGIEEVITGGGNDTLIGSNGGDLLVGGGNRDRIEGRQGNDTLVGDYGNDTIRGGAGDDDLTGGNGTDVLVGGAGRDVFRFTVQSDSVPERGDRLLAGAGGDAFDGAGGAPGDLIDLSGIDAVRAVAGDQAFVFGQRGVAGGLWLDDVGGVTYVRAQTDGVGADVEIAIEDGAVLASAYTAADFIL